MPPLLIAGVKRFFHMSQDSDASTSRPRMMVSLSHQNSLFQDKSWRLLVVTVDNAAFRGAPDGVSALPQIDVSQAAEPSGSLGKEGFRLL